jgi:hypothetical protein
MRILDLISGSFYNKNLNVKVEPCKGSGYAVDLKNIWP